MKRLISKKSINNYFGKDKPLWQQQAELNKSYRYPWRKLFGVSLTSKITELRNKGQNQKQVYHNIITEYPFITETARKRLQISISARFAEQDALLVRTRLSGLSKM